MRRIRILVAYDGTEFHGWQVQPGLPTVQGWLEKVVSEIEGAPVKVHGSGRTDAGVHALGQVAAFSLNNRIPCANLRRAMNRLLPPAIRVLHVEEAPPDFHPRYHARSKTYEYRIWRGEVCPPMRRLYLCHFPYPLDEERMIELAPLFEGEHDFSAFAAADERAARFRHPLPTARRIERYAMLVAGARRHGLHVSVTRLVHFGSPPAELQRRHAAVARIDAAFLAATRVGAHVGDVVRAGIAAYAAEGWPDDWRHHHQGGPTGYAGRDYRATEADAERIADPQAFAWNPTLPGVKSEDTVLAHPDGLDVLSATPDLPTTVVASAAGPIARPGIVER